MRVGRPFPANTVTLWKRRLRRPRPLERLSSRWLVALLWATAYTAGRTFPWLGLWAWLGLMAIGYSVLSIVLWRATEYERLYRLVSERSDSAGVDNKGEQ